MSSTRSQVLQLYKKMLHMGQNYPMGFDFFRARLKTAFLKHKDVQDEKEIANLVARGEFVCKELEALYMIRKYRTIKKRYYDK